MPYIAQVASGKRSHLNVFGSDYNTKDGTGIRDYIHVMDIAEGHKVALEHLSRLSPQSCQLHTFNLGTGTGCSVMEMVKAFELASGKNIPCRVTGRRAGDVSICYAQVDKAREQLKWHASRNLSEMCRSTWHFYMKSVVG